MDVVLTDSQWAELDAALRTEKGVRVWKRLQAVRLLAEGQAPATVAQTLHCCLASVYNWAERFRAHGVAGLREGHHGGGPRKLDAGGEALLTERLADDPQAHGYQATGWTVPLLRTELAAAGYEVGARTIRRALHRLGYRWKRPQYVLGRPDPAYTETRGPSSPPPRP